VSWREHAKTHAYSVSQAA